MQSNYKRLGDYIQEVNIRNRDLNDYPLLGVSVKKVFMPSIANTVGTDFGTYKIVKRNQFTYIPDTSRRGEKIGLALLDSYDYGLVSQAYTVFKIIDEYELHPEYLMMWFKRPEFDRYARVKSHGSVREIFDWQEMCDVLLPIPSSEKQIEIVREYNVIQNRIKLNNQLIAKLEETAQTIYKQWFVDFEFPNENGLSYKSNGGEMVQSELGGIPKGWCVKKVADVCVIKGGKRLPKGKELNNFGGNPYIKVADMYKAKFLILNSKFQFVDDNTQKDISRYIVAKGDLIISIVGTVGLVNIIDTSLNGANLTENCVKLTNFKNMSINLLYHFLVSKDGQRIIEAKTVGGVQGKLPLYNIQTIPIILPSNNLALRFEKIVGRINESLIFYKSQINMLNQLNTLLLAKMTKVEVEKEFA